MSSRERKILKFEDKEGFNISREECVTLFHSGGSMFKRKITQGLYWTDLDKDLANQFFRDERWFLGVKFWDGLKTIDHGGGDGKHGVGFKSK